MKNLLFSKKVCVALCSFFVFVLVVKGQAGANDSSFNPMDVGEFGNGSGINQTVRTSATQADGKIIIGGLFNLINGTTINRLARLNQNGSLDTSFNMGSGFNLSVISLAIQTDGKIIVGGLFTQFNGISHGRMVRLNNDGSIDTEFNIGSGFNNDVQSISIQANGKILVGGSFTSFNGTTGVNRIVRLNTDGTLDADFNSGTGFNNTINAIRVQPNGEILLGGAFTSFNGTTGINRIARLNSDGSLDTGFNPGTGFNNNTILTLAIQDDGKIIAGGSFTQFNGSTINRIARLNSDGTIDNSFNAGSGASSTVSAIVIQPDGKILLAGQFQTFNGTTVNRIVRLNASGAIDSTFNSGSGANDQINSMQIQSDGKITVFGNFALFNNIASVRLLRLLSDGSRDWTYNAVTGFNGHVDAIHVQADGKVLAGGMFTFYNGVNTNRIVRFNSSGSFDSTFVSGSGASSSITTILEQSDGKIIIVGQFTSYNGVPRNRIARLNGDGSLDYTFNPGTGFNNAATSAALQADGKIIVASAASLYNNTTINRIVRLNTDGSIDETFMTGTGFNALTRSVAIQPDGKIIIGGSFTEYNGVVRNYIARLNSDGSLDNTFNPASGFNGQVWTIVIQSDSKIIVGGDFTSFDGTSRNRIARLNQDGSLDSSFEPGTGFNDALRFMAIQDDEKIIVGGQFTSYNDNSINRIARLNNDAEIDLTFDSGTGFNATVLKISIQPNGRIIVGGLFTNYNDIPRNRIARLRAENFCETAPGIDEIISCDNYTWIDGNTYTSSNNSATHVLQNVAGCDSTVTLNLTINQPTFGTDVIEACGSHTWIDGINYTENNNTATHVLQNVAGCDSTVTLNLTISIPDADVSGPAEVCSNSPATISLSNSDADGLYFLRNDANNAIVDGPIAGTGAGLTFNTGNLTQNTTYNVLATLPVPSEALDFDGINDGVHVGQIQGITNSVSVEAWIFPKGNVGTTTWDRIFDGNWVNNFTFCSQGGMTNSLNLTMGGGAVVTAPNVLVPNQWQHVAFTYDDVTKVVRLYRNGIEVGSGIYNGGARTMTAPHTIGSNAVGTEAMNAIIDEVRLWNTTRTQAQLNENMNTCLTGNEPGLVLYFDFDDEIGSPSVTDKTGNGHNGTLVNMNPANDWVTGATVCVSCENEMIQTVTVAVSETPAPSGDLNQSFCNNATLSDLQASGENIQWYDAASGGNLLSAATALTNGTSYFASQTVDGCESVNRLAVLADVSSPSAPTATSPQTSCNGTVAELAASGSNIQWYDAATGGNLLDESTPLVNNMVYYASQTIDACESAGRTPVTAQVLTLIDQTVNEPSNPVLCENGSSQIAINSSEIGINYSLRNEDNVVVSGPSSGTGNALSFNTGNLTETSDFHVLAEVQPNTSIQFDGVNDFVNVGTSSTFNFSGAFTIETWIKVSAFDKGWQAIVTQGDNSWRLHRQDNTNRLSFATDGLTNFNLESNAAVNDDNWHHVAAVYTGTQKLIYINGVLDASAPATGVVSASSMAVLIGENSQAVNRHFNGKMDEVRIWNVARTQAQIQDNMDNQIEGNETGLLAYYRFNELAGAATALDYSTNNFNATLSNMDNNTVRQSDVPFQAPTCSFQLSETKTITVDPLSVAPSAVNSLYNMCHGGSTTLEIEGGSLASGADWEWFSGTCNTSVIGTGSSIEVTPTANTSYFARASAGSACPPSACAEINVNLPSTSTTLSLDGDVASCFVNQNEWVHFYNSNGRLIASINSGGQDLGNVAINAVVNASAAQIAACDQPSNPSFVQTVLGRSFVITPEHQPAENTTVVVRFYINENEFEAYQLAAENNQNLEDNADELSDLNLTKVSNGLSTGNPNDICDATDATVEFIAQSSSGNINALNNFTGFDETHYLEFSVDGFSEFFLMNNQNSSALPVQLTAFSAICDDDKIQISWTTASELNASHYILQSSRDGMTWLHLAHINAAGTTNQTSNYSYRDQNFGALIYYRLVQVDNNGQQEIFGPISSNCSINNHLMTVHPNPSSDNFTVIIQTSENFENATLELIEMSGRVILSQTTNINAGSTMLNFDVNDIQPGAYMIRVTGENDKFTPIRVVKM